MAAGTLKGCDESQERKKGRKQGQRKGGRKRGKERRKGREKRKRTKEQKEETEGKRTEMGDENLKKGHPTGQEDEEQTKTLGEVKVNILEHDLKPGKNEMVDYPP